MCYVGLCRLAVSVRFVPEGCTVRSLALPNVIMALLDVAGRVDDARAVHPIGVNRALER